MKILFLLLAALAPALSFAECLDLSGEYKIGEISAVKFRQTGCELLRVQYGRISEGGKVSWTQPALPVYLDGLPSCHAGVCWEGRADKNQIALVRDSDGLAHDSLHGACSYRKERYVRNEENTLVHIRDVFWCESGFEGQLRAPFAPLK